MYLGRPVEFGTKEAVFGQPRHPYSRALLSATPSTEPHPGRERIKLEGELPSPLNIPDGCPFAPRCWKATDQCRAERPELLGEAHKVACHLPEEGALA